jgi:hypothetical protein
MGGGGPGVVAAVCIRDHWDEMSESQRSWCVERACSEVVSTANKWGEVERMQRFGMSADRSCAWVVPLLLLEPLSSDQETRVKDALAALVTHPIDEVRRFAVSGIAEHFWPSDRALAIKCVNALAWEAMLIQVGRRKQEDKPYLERVDTGDILATAATTVRQAFWKHGGIPADASEHLDSRDWFSSSANVLIQTIMSRGVDDPVAVQAFVRSARTVVEWWDGDRDREARASRRERNDEAEYGLIQLLERFVFQSSPEIAKTILRPILDAVDRHPREVYSIVQGRPTLEDAAPNTPQYWFLWALFADAVKRSKWIAWLHRENPTGSEMLSALFLTSWWKEDVKHWSSLEGYAHLLHEFFDALRPTSLVFDCFVRFLYHVGEQSLPQAFIRLSAALRMGDSTEMLADPNTIFMLEVLLQRHIYRRGWHLKRDPELRNAVLHLLDVLVEQGSSACFGMRDDFVTPLVE